MIIPIIYPSAGEFWLKSVPESQYGYSFNNRKLTDIPEHEFHVTSKAAVEATDLLRINRPLYLTAPHQNYKYQGPNCVIRSHSVPYPPNSFFYLKYGIYDIYIACPELCFLLAARSLDLIDLVRFGFEMCSLYMEYPNSKYGQIDRTSYTSVSLIRDYITENSRLLGSGKALKALKFVRDCSNSPIETKLAIFAVLPEKLNGCGMGKLEMNKEIMLTEEGRHITGYPSLRGDLVFNDRVVVEYNSNMLHLSPKKYTDDMNRQTALKLAGYKYIGITYGNIGNYHSAINIMNVIRRDLRLPPLAEGNPDLYFRLFG